MADYMAAHIEIGGKLTRCKLNELLSLFEELSAAEYGNSPPNQEYLQTRADENKPLALYDDQARYGEFPELEEFALQTTSLSTDTVRLNMNMKDK